MNVLVYVPSGFDTIGGGRRVSADLSAAFLRAGHRTLNWSLRAAESSAESEPAASRFEAALERNGIELVLFDSEFALLEFGEVIGEDARWPRGIVRAALIHDQLWNDDARAMMLPSCGSDAARLAREIPSLPIRAYYAAERESLVALTGRDFRGGRVGGAWYKRNALWRASREARERFRHDREIQRRKRLVRELDLIFTLTERARRESIAAYGLSEDRVACAFGAPDYRPGVVPRVRDFRRESGSEGKKVLLSFARMAPEKYVEMTVLAFEHLSRTVPEAVLWLGGQVVASQRLYADFVRAVVSSLGVGGKVFEWGTCSEEEMVNLYEQSDGFVCSQPADFNLSAYTALKLGKPIVVPETYDFPAALRGSALIRSGPATIENVAARMADALRKPPSRSEAEDSFVETVSMTSYARSILDAASGLRARACA
ncbi:MAG TPA: glycosyltransferase [Thermoanaerobaculia bacterium]|nr:glycosyltransferase [Thermoanaerobaculia bacterium]